MRDTLLHTFAMQRRARANLHALHELAAGGAAVDQALTWAQWADASDAVAGALIAGGLRPGERVAILAGNRLAWPVADIGILLAGGVSVGIYPTSSAAQLRTILLDSGATTLIVDTAAQLEKAREAVRGLEAPRIVHGAADWVAGRNPAEPSAARPGLVDGEITWAAWLAGGRRALADDSIRAQAASRVDAVQPDDVAILIYTSGSTGEPKGAQLSHRYLLASAESIRETLGMTAHDRGLSFLPFCHAAERVFGMCTRVLCGAPAGLVVDGGKLWDAARAYNPTIVGGVPRMFEKLHDAFVAADAAARAGGGGADTWARAVRAGQARAVARRAGDPNAQQVADLVWLQDGGPVREWVAGWLGASLRVASSGGATLPRATAEGLDAIGVTVLGAYGLTEHLCVAFQRPGCYDLETSGPPMPGTEIRIADDGEIQVRRGPLTFAGYHGRPEAADEAFTPDGLWLRTGDLGTMQDGRLVVTGRLKELIALSAGKKVAPIAIEARLVAEPWIAQAVCYGEGRRYLTALLTLRRDVVERWALEQQLSGDFASLVAHPAVRAEVEAAVGRVNAQVSTPEQVRRFVVLARELSLEDGELTPTLKIRRSTVVERHHALLEALY